MQCTVKVVRIMWERIKTEQVEGEKKEMNEKNPLFANSVIKKIWDKKSSQGLDAINTKETLILVWKNFNTSSKALRKYLIAGVVAMWAIAGGIIVNLVVALITK